MAKKKTARHPAGDFIACEIKQLPETELVAASQTATRINPANAPVILGIAGLMESMDFEDRQEPITAQHIAVTSSKYWGNTGVDLTVGFMEQQPADVRARILQHMNSWGERCNVKFRATQSSPQVRITLGGDGYWSYLGTDILHIPNNQPTMCLQGFTMNTPESEYHRVVRHETGHTLGCPHEHLRSEIIALIDQNKCIAYFQRTQGWPANVTKAQVLTPVSETSIRGTPHADEDSIMCYQLPGSITKDGKPIRGGTDIDELDWQFMATMYPKADTGNPTLPGGGGGGGDGTPDFGKLSKIVLVSADGTTLKTINL